MYCKIQPDPPLGSALGDSRGLMLYITVYPSSCHNTDTVYSNTPYQTPLMATLASS